MKTIVKAVIMSAACAAVLGLAGCGGSADKAAKSAAAAPQGKLMQQIKDKGVLVVGTASGFPPYEFIDTSKEGKEVTGIDIALAQKVADKLGVKLKVQDMNFSALLSSIAANKIDIAIAGIDPTEERKKAVDFSDIYLPGKQTILIRKEDAGKFKTLDDFNAVTMGAQKSTIQETLVKKEIPKAKAVSLDKVPDLLLELKNHKVDGVAVQNIVAAQYLLFNPDIIDSGIAFKDGKVNSAVAVPKGNEDLIKVINEAIKENTDNGNFDKWVKEYSQKVVDNAKAK